MKFPKGVHRTKRPKFRSNMAANTGGRFWEACPVILPDGTTIEGYYEKVRGTYFYFQHQEQWYKAPLDYDTGGNRFTITPDLR